MDNAAVQDAAFRDAAAAIDVGDIATLGHLITARPALVRERLESPGTWLREKVGGALEGFFQRPYLLWFVAEDPVRNGRLPENIAEVTRALVDHARRQAARNLQEQLDVALTLVSWSWIARQCGVQLALVDVLVDAGANLDGNANNALVNGNVAAAEHLVERGAPLTLATALCLERWPEVERLLQTTSEEQLQFALVLTALNGRGEALRRLVRTGVALNAPSAALYPHGTPLHHAVSSGSLEAVQVLVEAGADLTARDSAWSGTPLGWAEYYLSKAAPGSAGKQYPEIVAYLRRYVTP